MRFGKTVFFAGNKERLKKTVRNAKGKMLSEQRFSVLVHDRTIRQHGLLLRAFQFRIHCCFQKKGNGYEIGYFVTPNWWTIVRIIVFIILWLVLYQKAKSVYLTIFVFLLLLVNFVRQGIHCTKQFEEMCKK